MTSSAAARLSPRLSALLLALAGTVFAPALFAQTSVLPVPQDAAAQLTIVPDRADWTYAPGASATMRVQVALKPYPAAGVPIRYRIGPDMREGEERTAIVPEQGLALAVPALPGPGFVRAIVTAELGGKKVSAMATAGFAPDKIAATQPNAADFDQFWTAQKALLAQVPADAKLTPAPALSTPTVEVFYVSLQNVGRAGNTSRVHGVLSVPRGPGPFPALLEVPGAGVRGYTGTRNLAERGIMTLQIGIHGIPVNLDPDVYLALGKGALVDYPRYELDDRERYYYRRVYLGAVRANDFLTSHPKWDGRHLTVMGGSQGGQLAIVTAALDKRVTALAANYPAYSDVTGYLKGTTGGWPGLFRTDAQGQTVDQPLALKVLTTRYYDTVNFARRLTVPGFYATGYNDMVTPPTSVFAAYNAITAPKELLVAPDQPHTASAAQLERREAWVLAQSRK